MIPKVIHYCWFGGARLPKSASRYIETWRRLMPGYEIREWNETNFDVNIIPYTEAAHRHGKYAFVSDYARYWIIHRHGGVYLDTDVELLRPLDEIIARGPFFGIEKSGDTVSVSPGLGMGAEAGNEFYVRMMGVFESEPIEDDACPRPLLVKETTRLLRECGFNGRDELQRVGDITIYPNEYFNPKDDYTGLIHVGERTVSIHHYAKTWLDGYSPLRNKLTQLYHRLRK